MARPNCWTISPTSTAPAQNSVIAFRYRQGDLQPLRLAEYPTGGTGSADLMDRGVLDADQQLITNPDGTLLFAVNQGSDTVAVFRIQPDGSLVPAPGSPFPSGGMAPASVGLSGDVLVVVNKAQDGIRDLESVQPNYTTFTVAPKPATSGVTVIDVVVFATFAVYEVVEDENEGLRAPALMEKLERSALLLSVVNAPSVVLTVPFAFVEVSL